MSRHPARTSIPFDALSKLTRTRQSSFRAHDNSSHDGFTGFTKLFELHHLPLFKAVEIQLDKTSPVKEHFLPVVSANEAEAMLVNDSVDRSVHISSHLGAKHSPEPDLRLG